MDNFLKKALIIQPGAIGDCILTLPLVKFLKETLGLMIVDFLSHKDYTSYLFLKSDIDNIYSIELAGLHKLFVDHEEFNINEKDLPSQIIQSYDCIISFMGQPADDFEKNLILMVNCTRAAQITTLQLKPPADYPLHVSQFYIQQYLESNQLDCKSNNHLSDVLLDFGKTNENNMAILAPGSGGKQKCWHLDNFIYIAQHLKQIGIEPVFTIGPAEIEYLGNEPIDTLAKEFKIIKNKSLTQLSEIINTAKYFIGNDSGIGHIASGLGIESYIIFGPTNSTHYRPIGPSVSILELRTNLFAFSQETCNTILNAIKKPLA